MINDNALDSFFTSECINYKSLTDPTRKLDVPVTISNPEKTDHLNDSPGPPWKQSIPKSYISDDWQGEAWYRVMGYAGTRILENPFTIAQVQSGMYVYIHLGNYALYFILVFK